VISSPAFTKVADASKSAIVTFQSFLGYRERLEINDIEIGLPPYLFGGDNRDDAEGQCDQSICRTAKRPKRLTTDDDQAI
jgi:hypothetical protein